MESTNSRDEIFSCCATFGDILIIGEELRIRLHSDSNDLVRDQRYRFRSYNTCFCAQEVTSWLVKTEQAPEQFIAVALMNILLNHNIIHSVTGANSFKDDSNLYRFCKDDGSYNYMEDTSLFLRGHALCKRISKDGQGEKIIRRHLYDQQLYTNCFLGCEFIDWLVQRGEAPSREEAVKEMRAMLESGIIRHVTDKVHFRDDDSLYQFRTDFARERILLDLILPPHEPEFGGPVLVTEKMIAMSDSCLVDNNNTEGGILCLRKSEDMAASSSNSPDTPDGSCTSRHGTQRTESGYHSDQPETPLSSLPDNSLLELMDHSREDSDNKSYTSGVLVREATCEELEDPDSPYVKKFIRIVSDPVGYGFVIRGEGPAYVKAVDPMGPAAAAGLKVGHYLLSLNDRKVLRIHHRNLAHEILDSNGYITLVVLEHVRNTR